jgi:hypothetical protein
MTKSEVMQKIESINYYHNRYIHNGACNLCISILNSKNFPDKIKREVKKIELELQELQEPWSSWNNRTAPDFNILNSICDCLNSIYGLME